MMDGERLTQEEQEEYWALERSREQAVATMYAFRNRKDEEEKAVMDAIHKADERWRDFVRAHKGKIALKEEVL